MPRQSARTVRGGSPSTRQELEERVRKLGSRQAWAHDIELPHGVRTRPDIPYEEGKTSGKWGRLESIFEELELDGKRVLDMACNEGFYSVEAARRGARVVGVDIDEARIEKAEFVRDALDLESVEYRTMDIYGDAFEGLGRFDVCLALGLIHRLPDPFRAIQRIMERADLAVFEWLVLRRGNPGDPVAHYIPGRNRPGAHFAPTYWRPSTACVKAILSDLGCTRFRLIEDRRGFRVILLAGRSDHPVLRPRPGDVRRRPLLSFARWGRDAAVGLGRTLWEREAPYQRDAKEPGREAAEVRRGTRMHDSHSGG